MTQRRRASSPTAPPTAPATASAVLIAAALVVVELDATGGPWLVPGAGVVEASVGEVSSDSVDDDRVVRVRVGVDSSSVDEDVKSSVVRDRLVVVELSLVGSVTRVNVDSSLSLEVVTTS